MKRDESGLLDLLHARFKELDLGREIRPGDPVYRRPMWNSADLERINRAVDLHAQANIGDPFAGPRMRCHLLRGLDTASEVMRAAQSTLAAKAIT